MIGRGIRRAGVTLVEAMVAVAILAVVGTLVWNGFSQTNRNRTRMERALEQTRAVMGALDRMQRELSMAFVSVHRPDNPSLQVVRTAFVGKDRPGGDRVDFTAFAHRRLRRDARESDQCELGYFLARDPDRSGLRRLVRREQHRIDDDATQGGRFEVLLDGVRDLQFEYLDPVQGEWLDAWDSTQPAAQPNRLPAQVRIRLTVEDWRDGRARTFGTRAQLPIVWALNHAAYRAR
ncbi:MAG: prepilin-type N-terminal cleavage/methylation domain-containing protein [Myxococcota bacterium]|nr:prepilin-type N-terminal cleavage/methylation domain-containing protein [Myxococcota bacterium]MDW8360821.1 type II secretion system protein GspJ [Myxococcales bacterium]